MLIDSAREFIPFGIELPGQELNIYNSWMHMRIQGKEGNDGGCLLALTTHILTLPLRPHGSPIIKPDVKMPNWH